LPPPSNETSPPSRLPKFMGGGAERKPPLEAIDSQSVSAWRVRTLAVTWLVVGSARWFWCPAAERSGAGHRPAGLPTEVVQPFSGVLRERDVLLRLKLPPTPDQIPADHPINRCLIQYPLQSETAPKQGVKFGPSAGGGSRAFPPARRSASRSIEAANCCLAPVEYPEQCSGQS
jgi:hypothetical protein